MESRKMVLMNLFSGQQWGNRREKRRMDPVWGEEREGTGQHFPLRKTSFKAASTSLSLEGGVVSVFQGFSL